MCECVVSFGGWSRGRISVEFRSGNVVSQEKKKKRKGQGWEAQSGLAATLPPAHPTLWEAPPFPKSDAKTKGCTLCHWLWFNVCVCDLSPAAKRLKQRVSNPSRFPPSGVSSSSASSPKPSPPPPSASPGAIRKVPGGTKSISEWSSGIRILLYLDETLEGHS